MRSSAPAGRRWPARGRAGAARGRGSMPSRVEAARRYVALLAAVRRARRAPFDPFKLTWIVTERCSLRCRTCRLWATEPAAGPSLAEAERVIAANPHLTWLNLSGGDLVERPD